jgi:hypothetical protein
MYQKHIVERRLSREQDLLGCNGSMFFSQSLTFIEKSLPLTLGLGLVILEASAGRPACLSLLTWHIERLGTELGNGGEGSSEPHD